jgi:hypothetical protein
MSGAEMKQVAAVRALPGYRLDVQFTDGARGVIDYTERLRGAMASPLRDPEKFAEVDVDSYGGICWPNGFDICPDTLYDRLATSGALSHSGPALESTKRERRLASYQPPRMPILSQFFGITIRMFWRDHGAPHFHAEYGGSEASLSIESLEILEGRLPPRARRLVREWALLHRPELLENWRRVQRHGSVVRIAGLDREDE